MDKQTLKDRLERDGELILTLDSDGYAEPIELHIHDTMFGSDGVTHQLADGEIWFAYSSIESVTIHQQTTADLGV